MPAERTYDVSSVTVKTGYYRRRSEEWFDTHTLNICGEYILKHVD